MSAVDILANTARGWNRDPTMQVKGTEQTGVQAALWIGGSAWPDEVTAEPDLAHHILSFHLVATKADVFIDGRRTFSGVVPRASCQLMSAGVRPRAVFYGLQSTLHFYIPTEFIDRLIAASEFSSPSQFIEFIDPRYGHDAAIERIAQEVVAEMRDGQPLSRLRIDALGQELIIQLLREHSNTPGNLALALKPNRGGLAPWQLARALDMMNDRLGDDLTIAELAHTAGLSQSYFARCFRSATGQSPHQYLMSRRLDRAKDLLRATSMPLSEVALACGFSSQSHLSNRFRAATGVSPGMYRRAL